MSSGGVNHQAAVETSRIAAALVLQAFAP